MIKLNEDRPERVLVLKISLTGSQPLIWRRLAIRSDATLSELHRAIQCIMPWELYHLYEFIVGDKHYGVPHPDYGDSMLDEEDVALAEVFVQQGGTITYVYDFGDGWLHQVEYEGVADPHSEITYPSCLAGENAAPPEDSGALFGYYDKLRILNDLSDPDHCDIKEWMPRDFDPSAFSIEAANMMLVVDDHEDDDELVFRFVDSHAQDDYGRVRDMFSSRGAYARYKEFLASKRLLDKWYVYEQDAQEKALRDWAGENGIKVT